MIKDFDLSKKNILVTGGASNGYGKQIVEILTELGAKVIISSRNFEKADRKCKVLQNSGFNVFPSCLDLLEHKQIEKEIGRLHSEFGIFDVLINNAVLHAENNIDSLDLDEWNNNLKANITGTMLISKIIGSNMFSKNGGSIINIGSIYGVISPDHEIYGNSGINSPLVYGICKASIIQMTKYLATYWAPKVRVNCISPGGLFDNQDEFFVNNYCKKTPLKRMANQKDLKGIIALLASDASSYITGQNFIVDGGWTSL